MKRHASSMITSGRYTSPDREKLQRQYEERFPLYTQLMEEIEYSLTKAIKSQNIETSRIEPRVKAFDSFYDKIVRNELSTGDLFKQVDDVAGVRVICLYRSDLEAIESIIRKTFNVKEAKISRDSASPSGYLSDHFIVTLPKHYHGERYDAIKELRCEIQVRSVAMHAWATISHHLVYKQEADVPSSLKDDFVALSGVFYIADSLFDQFRAARENSLSALTRRLKRLGLMQLLDAEINLDTLMQYLRLKFPKREHSNYGDVSELMTDIRRTKMGNYRELDRIIDKHMSWLKKDEKKNPPVKGLRKLGNRVVPTGYTKYADIGVVRAILREEKRLRSHRRSR